jgi:anti-sigma factor RsiW
MTRVEYPSAIAAAAVIALVLLERPWQPDFPAAAADDHAAVASGDLRLEIRTADTARLERWLDERLPFRTRVFDFAMMRYELLGGRVDSLKGRSSALFAYRGERGDLIVCQMFEGRTAELPPAAETREHDGITFHIYQRDGRTAVFWQEGVVVCVLVGETAAEEVISLAFAKAMKV